MITLFGTGLSSYTAKVRIALYAKGLSFEERTPRDGYKSEEWRRRVPTRTIPAIAIEGSNPDDEETALLPESEAIIEYLEDQYPDPSLYPGTPQERAHVRYLARFHDMHLEPRVRALFSLVRDVERTQEMIEAHALDVEQKLAMLDRIASPAPYIAGVHFSAADCGLVVSITLAQWIFEALETPLSVPHNIQLWLITAHRHPAVVAGLTPWRVATERWLTLQLTMQLPDPIPGVDEAEGLLGDGPDGAADKAQSP